MMITWEWNESINQFVREWDKTVKWWSTQKFLKLMKNKTKMMSSYEINKWWMKFRISQKWRNTCIHEASSSNMWQVQLTQRVCIVSWSSAGKEGNFLLVPYYYTFNLFCHEKKDHVITLDDAGLCSQKRRRRKMFKFILYAVSHSK